MERVLSAALPAFCLSAVLTLSACASHSTASNQRRPNSVGSTASGVIPTTDGRHSQLIAGNTVGGATGAEYEVPTGSMIPRHVTREGYTTDAADPTFVYDQNDIRFQSTDNVADQLRTIPGVQVRGNP